MSTYLCTACGKEVAAPELWFNQAGQPFHHACYGQRFGSNAVVVRDIDMPFGSMVSFILKWSIAAIPAILIFAFVGFVLGSCYGAMVP